MRKSSRKQASSFLIPHFSFLISHFSFLVLVTAAPWAAIYRDPTFLIPLSTLLIPH